MTEYLSNLMIILNEISPQLNSVPILQAMAFDWPAASTLALIAALALVVHLVCIRVCPRWWICSSSPPTRYLRWNDANMANTDEANLTVITAVFVCGSPIKRDALVASVRKHLVPELPFRSRVVRRTWLWPYYEPIAEGSIDFAKHIVEQPLADPNSQAELESLCSELQRTPLDGARPLWSWHIVPSFNGGCALIFRCHHIFGDGIQLLRLLVRMTTADGARAEALEAELAKKRKQRAARGKFSLFARVRNAVAIGIDSVVALASLLGLQQDVESALKPGTIVQKTVLRWSAPLSLARIKMVARRCGSGASVNDVTLACLYGAIRRCLLANGHPLPSQPPTSICWVSLRPLRFLSCGDEPFECSNRIGVIYLKMLVDVESPRERVAALQRTTAQLKRSQQPTMSFALMTLFGLLPPIVGRVIFNATGFKTTASFSNVPGPQWAAEMVGSPLKQFVVTTRPQGSILSFFLLMSYNGEVTVAMSAAEQFPVKHDELFVHFNAELDALEVSVGAE